MAGGDEGPDIIADGESSDSNPEESDADREWLRRAVPSVTDAPWAKALGLFGAIFMLPPPSGFVDSSSLGPPHVSSP